MPIDPDSSPSETNRPHLENAEEYQPLRESHRTGVYIIDEPPDCHPIAICLFVLLPAIFGFAFYFASQYRGKANIFFHGLDTNSSNANLTTTSIIISIDSFRHDYLSRTQTGTLLAPTLNKLAKEGVYSPNGMKPVMPTKTWPNHWSLVTGLYPETHGIIANNMYDPNSQMWFHHDTDNYAWWNGEPIWRTLMRTRKSSLQSNSSQTPRNYTTATVFWPGSTVEKHRPDVFWKWDPTISHKRIIERAVQLLTGSASDLNGKADFVTLYFNQLDQVSHLHGPNSPQVNNAISEVDAAIASLQEQLAQANLTVNFIIVSDHGMSEIDDDHKIDISNALSQGTVQDVVISPMGLWLNMTISSEKVYNELRNSFLNRDTITVYRKEDLPDHWHLKGARLMTDVVTLAKLGWSAVYPHQHLVPNTTNLPFHLLTSSRNHGGSAPEKMRGEHGYSHDEADMQAIFIANGPAFQRGKTISKISSVDVYGILCHIYSAEPAPNNGSSTIISEIVA